MVENNVEIVCKHIPDIKIIFQSGKIFELTMIHSFSQKIKNNFDFKNCYECSIAAIPEDFLHLIENPNNQIKEVQIIDTYASINNGEEYQYIHSIKCPEIEVNRTIDSSMGYAPWILKIGKKLL